jgi:hypothetical protein
MDGDQRVTWHRNSYDKFGIFFCGIAKEFQFDPKYNIDKVDNKEILTKKGRIQYSPYSGSYEGIINLKNGKITTKAELYKILKRYPNLNIPETAEKEPWDHDIITIEDFNKYLHDSINHKGAFKLPKQAVQKKDSLKNGTRP